MDIVSTKNLYYYYNRREALKDINLNLPRGTVTGLIGHNGSGKSTLFKVILNELLPTAGFLNNKSKSQGFLIENGSFYEHLTAYQNLKFNYYAQNTSIADIQEMLAYVGLNNEQNNKVSAYSMGMKKRLSIAMAFVSNPDLILLDEPTNELDTDGINILKNLIVKWNKEHGTSIIYASHKLTEVVEICDYLLILNRGEIVYQGYRNKLEEMIGSIREQTLDFIYNSLKKTICI